MDKLPLISPLEESIHILNVLRDDLNKDFKSLIGLANYGIDELTVQNLSLLMYARGIILVASYIDELDKHFNKHLNSEYGDEKIILQKIKKKISTDTIKKRYPDIKRYRNDVLAHNLRIDNLKGVFLYGDLRDYKIPQNITDFRFLWSCINLLTICINRFFPDSYIKVQEYVSKRQTENANPYKTPLTEDEVDSLLCQLGNDLDQLLAGL